MNKENIKKNMCKTICTQCKYIRIDTDKHQDYYRDEDGDYLCTAYHITTMDCTNNTEHITCSKCKDKNKGCCKKYKVDTERKNTQSLITQLEKIIKRDINSYAYGSCHGDTPKELIIQDAINILEGYNSDILIQECYKCDDYSCSNIVTKKYYDLTTNYYKREQEYKKKEQERKRRSRW